MLAELGADLGGNFEGKQTRGLFVVSPPPELATMTCSSCWYQAEVLPPL